MITILDNLLFILDGIILYIYYETLLNKQRKNISAIYVIIFFLFAQVIFGILTGFLTGDTSQTATYFRCFLSFVINYSLTFFYNISVFERTFVTVGYTVLISITEEVAYRILSHYVDINVQTNQLTEWSFVAISYISNLLLLVFVLIFHALWKKQGTVRSLTYSLLLITIPVLSICLTLLPQSFELVITNPDFFVILNIFLFIMNIVNYILLSNVLRTEELEHRTKLLDEQITYQKQKYAQLGEAYKNIRSFMHDTKHHFFTIRSYLENQEYNSIMPHVQEAMNDLESRYCAINTGCLVIDAFVSNYILRAQTNNIQLITNLKIESRKIPVSDYHLAIILGNLLDNAFNSCQGQPFPKIVLYIQIVNNSFVIHIANTYIPKQNDMVTNHLDEIDFIHGYGLDNVKKSAEASGGFVSIRHQNDTYNVVVIVPFNSKHYTRPI